MNNMLLWMLEDGQGIGDLIDSESAQTIWNTVVDAVTIVVWAIVAALAVVLVIKGITTALAVVKAADEPQVRQEKINGFKYLAIGLGIAIVILSLSNIIMTTIMDQGESVDLTTFLF